MWIIDITRYRALLIEASIHKWNERKSHVVYNFLNLAEKVTDLDMQYYSQNSKNERKHSDMFFPIYIEIKDNNAAEKEAITMPEMAQTKLFVTVKRDINFE